MSNSNLGMCHMISSIVASSFEGLIIKYLSHLGSLVQIYCRSIFSIGVIIAFHNYNKIDIYYGKDQYNTRIQNKLILRSITGALAFNCFTYTIANLNISEAYTLIYLFPMWSGALGAIILHEKFTFIEICCSLCGLSGIIFVMQPPLIFGQNENFNVAQQYQTTRTFSVIIGILASFFVGCNTIVLRTIPKHMHTFTQTLYFFIGSGITSGFMMIKTEENRLKIVTLRDISLIIFMSFIGIYAQFGFSKALQLEKAGKVTIICYMTIIIAYIYDIFIFKNADNISKLSVIGSCLIISSAGFLMYKNYIEARDAKIMLNI